MSIFQRHITWVYGKDISSVSFSESLQKIQITSADVHNPIILTLRDYAQDSRSSRYLPGMSVRISCPDFSQIHEDFY